MIVRGPFTSGTALIDSFLGEGRFSFAFVSRSYIIIGPKTNLSPAIPGVYERELRTACSNLMNIKSS